MSERELPALFIPHGAGPCFFMAWDPPEAWDRMGAWLRRLVDRVGGKPEALLVVSAHWQADVFTVNTRTAHELLFDYHGFPEHTYRITWPARGDAGLAADVVRGLEAAGLDTAEDPHRGLDHGVFIPMKLAFPEADVPVVQLSLKSGLEPGEHVAAGRALQALRRQGVLIVGSGMSYHNMAHFRHGGGETDPDSERFDRWLAETVALERTQRERRLLDWASAPGGRASHPAEEHLIPLHVVAGAAGADAGRRVFQDTVIGSVQSAFMFG
jgi:aromatic ring-opening dioxygenase catalytic subunit (LigB family)